MDRYRYRYRYIFKKQIFIYNSAICDTLIPLVRPPSWTLPPPSRHCAAGVPAEAMQCFEDGRGWDFVVLWACEVAIRTDPIREFSSSWIIKVGHTGPYCSFFECLPGGFLDIAVMGPQFMVGANHWYNIYSCRPGNSSMIPKPIPALE